MKNLYSIFMILLLAFSLVGHCVDSVQQEWTGKYPSELFNNTDALEILDTFLSPTQIKKIKSELVVEFPITGKDKFLIIQGCKPHDCHSENYMLFLNLKEKKVYLCLWKAKNRSKGDMTFYGSHFLNPLLFEDIETDFGCDFTDEALKDFIEEMTLTSDETRKKEVLERLVNDRRRTD